MLFPKSTCLRGAAKAAWRGVLLFSLMLFACILSSGFAHAQTAAMSGLITDPSGAVIQHAKLTLTNERTHAILKVTSDNNGLYNVSHVPPGKYTLRVVAPGFKEYEQTGITIVSAQALAFDAHLQLGGASQVVTVNADLGYLAETVESGTKTATPLIDTPQSITAVTRAQIDAQGAQTLSETLRYAAGVDAEPYGVDTRVDWFFIRGFGLTFDGLFLDGLAVPKIVTADIAYTSNPYSLQQVDILKGPASVLYGQSEPGGLINLTSKRPTEAPYGSIRFEGGTFDRFQGLSDISGSILGSRTLFYRVNGLVREAGTQMNFARDNQAYIAPSFLYKPSDRTSLTILGNYLDLRSASAASFLPAQGMTLAGGKIAPNPNGAIPTNFFESEPANDGFRKIEYFGATQFQHQFSNGWVIRNNFRYLRVGLPEYRGLFGDGFLQIAPDCALNINAADCTRILTRSAFLGSQNHGQYAIDQQFQRYYRLNKWTHTLLAGYNYQHQGSNIKLGYGQSETSDTIGDPANGPNIDIFHPVYGASVQFPGDTTTSTVGTLQQHGVYVQDQVSRGSLNVALSGREDWAPEHVFDRIASQQIDSTPSKFTGRIGVLYHFSMGLAPYFSYSTSFNPVPGINPSTNQAYKPDTGEQFEAGLKYQPKAINAFLTASIFQITQNNLTTSNPTNPLLTDQSAQQRSRGIELEGHASLSHAVNAIVSFDHQQVVFSKPYYGLVGIHPWSVPMNQASLWLDYDPRHGFGIGVGTRFTGKTAGGLFDPATPDQNFYVDSHTLFDFEAHYTRGGMRVGVNAQNLLDKVYVSYCIGNADCNWGDRRTVNGNVTYRFSSLLVPWRRN